MKNLIITLSFFLLLPLTGHANGLMKFKKVKAGEVATKKSSRVEEQPTRVAPKLTYEYVLGVHTAVVNFMIKLESDIEKNKVSRSEGERVLRILREQLLIAEAQAQNLARGATCFYAGRRSTMSSPSVCAKPPGAQGSCGAGKVECDTATFGSGICISPSARGAGLTRGCSIALDADPEKKRTVIQSLQQDPAALQRISDERRAFCTSYQSTNGRAYDGCAELLANTPGPAQPVVQQPAVEQPAVAQPAVAESEPQTIVVTGRREPAASAIATPQPVRAQAVHANGQVTAGNNCQSAPMSEAFINFARTQPIGTRSMNTRAECGQIKDAIQTHLNRMSSSTAYSNEQRQTADSQLSLIGQHDCNQICSDPEEAARRAAEQAENQRQDQAAGVPGQPKARRMGSAQGAKESYGCFERLSPAPPDDCLSLLTQQTTETEDFGIVVVNSLPKAYFKPIERPVDLENPHSFVRYFMGQDKEITAALQGYKASITPVKYCRLLASGCQAPTASQTRIVAYGNCLGQAKTNFSRPLKVGIEKTIAIVAAAKETTEFESDDNYGGMPFECKGNKGDNAGLGFDHPKCKKFYNWYVGLEATSTGFKVGNEAAVTTENMRNQTRLQQQIEEGNGQDAGFEASRNASIASQKAEERNMGFFAAKGALILAQLNNWPSRKNICEGTGCCELFRAEGADRIDRDFFPNADAKNHIYAQAIAAATEVMVAKFKADLHKENARKVQAIKEQMQFTDESEEGVMKFCLQFPQDVRCLSPGERRAMGASGTQFGSFQGSNFGLGSLEGEQGNEVSAGQDFGGSLAAGGPSGNVGNIGSADKDAAAAKNIFNAPAPARGGGGGGGGAGAGGGGGGGGGSAQAGQLSRDEGLKEDKKESPIEITSKKAAYEGSKGGYNGGGYNPSNKKPGESPTANPFAGMFGKDQGRDPANVAEIDKPASDLFAKISRRYGEVQKRKALMEVADESSGIR